MADFNYSNIELPASGLESGKKVLAKNMLGDAGADAVGFSKWVEVHRYQWKTFHLQPVDQTGALAGTYELHAAMELDPVDPDANTKFETLATLNAAGPSFSTQHPWRWVRIEVTSAPAAHHTVRMLAHS